MTCDVGILLYDMRQQSVGKVEVWKSSQNPTASAIMGLQIMNWANKRNQNSFGTLQRPSPRDCQTNLCTRPVELQGIGQQHGAPAPPVA